MGRIRSIRPEFFRHEGLFDLEQTSGLPIRVAFAGLWTCCDREGRFKWRPRSLKVEILPYDEVDFSRVLDALATGGFIRRYEADSQACGFIPSWRAHQFINNKEAKSELPEPPLIQIDDVIGTRDLSVTDATDTRGVKERKGKEGTDASETREKPILPEMVARGVMDELGQAGNELFMCLNAICRKLLPESAPDKLRRDLVTAWETYKKAVPELSWNHSSPTKFFGSDLWQDEKLWPWKHGHVPRPATSARRYADEVTA